ncbi:MAG: uncharacterized protein A8A55_1171 [Amphiamblys sp. WSBS2006]|nr:MAG: uncharacterized protein A8A55_1171 [Amphiamblys sp. WSBS2006]
MKARGDAVQKRVSGRNASGETVSYNYTRKIKRRKRETRAEKGNFIIEAKEDGMNKEKPIMFGCAEKEEYIHSEQRDGEAPKQPVYFKQKAKKAGEGDSTDSLERKSGSLVDKQSGARKGGRSGVRPCIRKHGDLYVEFLLDPLNPNGWGLTREEMEAQVERQIQAEANFLKKKLLEDEEAVVPEAKKQRRKRRRKRK